MNKVVLVGRITKDPELKYTGQGTAVASFTLAVNRRFKSKTGENETDFIPVVAWGNQGENTAKYCAKGSQIAVYGRLQVRNYQANDGTKRYATEVIAEEVTFLGNGNKGNSGVANNATTQIEDFSPMEEDDDLPF